MALAELQDAERGRCFFDMARVANDLEARRLEKRSATRLKEHESVSVCETTIDAQLQPVLPTTKGAGMPDRDLLDSFLIARNRIRGALVAINERTMITNVGASELLQPGDRRLLWEHVTRETGRCARASTMLVLSNGVTVTVRSQSVVSQLGAVGAVLHLCVERLGRATSPTARPAMTEAEEGSVEGRPLDPSLMAGWKELTDAERTVAELVARGMTNKQAGRRMFSSPHTVDYHLRRVFKKLGVNSRVELARALGEHYEALKG
jgi:DNA-binding CsgD family transcriptional regulator